MNDNGVTLIGYAFSVYTRSVRIALIEADCAFEYEECDPFEKGGAAALLGRQPFGRVPVLWHGGFHLYETVAILDYIGRALGGTQLIPEGAQAQARTRQVMSIIDAYVYWPMVRQAVSEGVFMPLEGRATDPTVKAAGLAKAPVALDALEEIACEGMVLRPGELTLACCHLWPMLAYFDMLPEGRAMLHARPALMAWWDGMAGRVSVVATRPDLSGGETL